MASIRNVLITGASSGIGREMAVWWARKGCRVYAAARRRDRLDALAAEFPGLVEPVILDVSDAAAVVDRVRAMDGACGGLDAVVANAGVSVHAPADLAEWEPVAQVLRVNVLGAAATLSAIAPRMAARRRGHLAGVSSAACHVPLGVNGAYAASKAFLSMFVRSMRVDMRGTGVKVTLVEPGFVRSEMTAAAKHTPLIVDADRAADRFCSAIERGDRLVRFPKIHSAATIAAGHLPAWALERIGRRTMESRRREFMDRPGG
ncbi:MAG: SDR family NAD(P)-dependent oxidoreductase [bacterium]|nr:SDR family NAD(P)-dependent oxidoreductase [bacterium]